MSSLPLGLRIWTMVAMLGAAVSLAAAGTGYVPAGGVSTVVPVSVRANPASWRPVYAGWSGWYAPSSSGGGGFGFGK